MDNTDILKVPVPISRPFWQKRKIRSSLEPSMGHQVTSELLPFRNVMSYQLNRRGYNTKNIPFNELIPLYYNEFVSNKDNSNSIYKPINTFDFRNNPIFKLKTSDSFNGDLESYTNRRYFTEINSVIDSIIDNFKFSQLKKRYAFTQGINPKEALTKDELIQANATDHITSSLENKILFDKPLKQGQLVNIMLWVFFGFVLFYLLD